MFVWRYEGTICVYALFGVVFGGIYVEEHSKEGVVLRCKVDGLVFGVACHSFVKLIL